jgi:hypothetical protein
MVRFIWQFSYEDSPCGSSNNLDTRPIILAKVHYLHFAIILFILTFISAWSISILVSV